MDSDSESEDDIFGYDGTLNYLNSLHEEESKKRLQPKKPVALKNNDTYHTITIDSDDDIHVPGTPKNNQTHQTVTIDSDDDLRMDLVNTDESGSEVECNSSFLDPNVSFDNSEIEETVRFVFNSSPSIIYRYVTKRAAALAPIFTEVAATQNLSADEIEVFTESGLEVSSHDSIMSINYESMQLLHVTIRGVDHVFRNLVPPMGSLLVNCKLGDRKSKVLAFHVLPQQSLAVLMIKCARELKCHPSKFKLVYDGETIKASDTCDTLDLENGDTVEVHWRS